MRQSRQAIERFLEKVQFSDGGCWLWQGGIKNNGYGVFHPTTGHRTSTIAHAHKWFWEYAFGPVPDGFELCHTCDNRPCVRLDHIFTGTRADNLHDMANKGRAWWQNPVTAEAWRTKIRATIAAKQAAKLQAGGYCNNTAPVS